ncbi:enoyl-CoA hydratase-related protein, partial [Mesorhizobium sp. M7A.F.Ca.ET.027.03.2.1]
VIASDESTFRVPFVDFGLVPDAATSILAPQKLGYAGAFRFFCLGDTLRAEDARALGLVAEIVPGGTVEEAALGRARQLVKKPVAALLQTRGLLKGNTEALCDRIDQEISLFQQALQDDTTLRRLQRIARLAA